MVVAAEETELTVALGRAGVTQGGRRLGGWALLCVLEEGGRAVRGRGAGTSPGWSRGHHRPHGLPHTVCERGRLLCDGPSGPPGLTTSLLRPAFLFLGTKGLPAP